MLARNLFSGPLVLWADPHSTVWSLYSASAHFHHLLLTKQITNSRAGLSAKLISDPNWRAVQPPCQQIPFVHLEPFLCIQSVSVTVVILEAEGRGGITRALEGRQGREAGQWEQGLLDRGKSYLLVATALWVMVVDNSFLDIKIVKRILVFPVKRNDVCLRWWTCQLSWVDHCISNTCIEMSY